MAEQDLSESAVSLKEMWWVVLLQGIILLLLGVWLLVSPGISVSVLLYLLGIYWIIIGLLHIVSSFVGNPGRSRLWLFVSGLLDIVIGVFALNNPFFSALLAGFSIVLIISVLLVIEGISNIIRSARGGGAGALIMGILSLLIGFFLLFNPTGSIAALPFVIGIMLLIGGVGLIVGSFGIRSLAASSRT